MNSKQNFKMSRSFESNFDLEYLKESKHIICCRYIIPLHILKVSSWDRKEVLPKIMCTEYLINP